MSATLLSLRRQTLVLGRAPEFNRCALRKWLAAHMAFFLGFKMLVHGFSTLPSSKHIPTSSPPKIESHFYTHLHLIWRMPVWFNAATSITPVEATPQPVLPAFALSPFSQFSKRLELFLCFRISDFGGISDQFRYRLANGRRLPHE